MVSERDAVSPPQEGATDPAEVSEQVQSQGAAASIREGVQSIRQDMASSSLEQKVGALSDSLGSMSEGAQRQAPQQPTWRLEDLELLQAQVREIQEEWTALSNAVNAKLERLDSLLTSFPGAVEISTIRALSLRLNQLDQLISSHIEEERARQSAETSKKQLMISLTALGVTVVLWVVFIVLRFIP